MTFWSVAIITLAVVGMFVLALSLTIIFKGRNIRSEVGTNPDMQRLGITCPAKEARDGDARCDGPKDPAMCGDCAACPK